MLLAFLLTANVLHLLLLCTCDNSVWNTCTIQCMAVRHISEKVVKQIWFSASLPLGCEKWIYMCFQMAINTIDLFANHTHSLNLIVSSAEILTNEKSCTSLGMYTVGMLVNTWRYEHNEEIFYLVAGVLEMCLWNVNEFFTIMIWRLLLHTLKWSQFSLDWLQFSAWSWHCNWFPTQYIWYFILCLIWVIIKKFL